MPLGSFPPPHETTGKSGQYLSGEPAQTPTRTKRLRTLRTSISNAVLWRPQNDCTVLWSRAASRLVLQLFRELPKGRRRDGKHNSRSTVHIHIAKEAGFVRTYNLCAYPLRQRRRICAQLRQKVEKSKGGKRRLCLGRTDENIKSTL